MQENTLNQPIDADIETTDKKEIFPVEFTEKSLVSPKQKLQFEYNGSGAELFGIYLKTIFLTIITLGIYRFWGKVEITKFFYASTRVGDHCFAYHATGKEKLIAFIKGIFFVGLFLFIMFLINVLFTTVLGPIVGSIIVGIVYIATFFIIQPLLIFGSHRFWLSRSSYCNVRFRYQFDLMRFTKIYLKDFLLVLLTLGIYFPWFLNKLFFNLISNTYLGDKKFSYHGNSKDIFKIYAVGFLLTILTLGIYSFWFRANLTRYICNNTELDNNPIHSEITGLDYFLVTLYSIVLVLFTLGIGFSWAVNNAFRVFITRMSITIDPAELANFVNYSDTQASAFADGVGEAAEAIDVISDIF
jgi:uncharacterized membrane protein YjgN (DUF898 family)